MDSNKQVALGALGGFFAGVFATALLVGTIALAGAAFHAAPRGFGPTGFHGSMMSRQYQGGPGYGYGDPDAAAQRGTYGCPRGGW